jgi:hypothetical protein
LSDEQFPEESHVYPPATSTLPEFNSTAGAERALAIAPVLAKASVAGLYISALLK